jgi:hypothetical protein
MRVIFVLLAFFAYVTCAAAPPSESAVIARAKGACACAIDGTIDERISLEEWLKRRALNAVVAWEANDCGEQTGDPSTTPSDFPICAEATFSNCVGARSSLGVVVASFRSGIADRFGIMWAVTDRKDVRTLRDFALDNAPCRLVPR